MLDWAYGKFHYAGSIIAHSILLLLQKIAQIVLFKQRFSIDAYALAVKNLKEEFLSFEVNKYNCTDNYKNVFMFHFNNDGSIFVAMAVLYIWRRLHKINSFALLQWCFSHNLMSLFFTRKCTTYLFIFNHNALIWTSSYFLMLHYKCIDKWNFRGFLLVVCYQLYNLMVKIHKYCFIFFFFYSYIELIKAAPIF